MRLRNCCLLGSIVILSFLATAQTPQTFSSGRDKNATGQNCQGNTVTTDQADAILQELKNIRITLERSVALRSTASPKAGAPALDRIRSIKVFVGDEQYAMGNPNAPITLIEFTDYQCPYCRTFNATTFQQLKKAYIDLGQLRFTSHDFPLSFHPNSRNAALALRCAGAQGKYWEMRELLLSADTTPSEEKIKEISRALELRLDRFEACMIDKTNLTALDADLELADKISVRGTPTFLLGKISNGVLEGIEIRGTQTFSAFRQQIEQMIASDH